MRKANILIIGAGSAGTELAADIKKTKQPWDLLGFLDDFVQGAHVLGTMKNLDHVLRTHAIHKVFFAIPRIKTDQLIELRRTCHVHGVDFLLIPPDPSVVTSGASVSLLRPLRVSDILGRSFERGDLNAHRDFYQGLSVMVTGAAGSIGSELVAQLTHTGVKQLICVDKHEYGIFELTQTHGSRKELRVAIADLTQKDDVEGLFQRFGPPDVLFHAAAYKHVPLMESHAKICIKNNILSFKHVADTAAQHGVKRFVLVSSDKAVHPANVMGATKRHNELSMCDYQDAMHINAVRFGNVLNSSGSVIPIFQRQIEQGGPVTVTDKRMKRYFMSIPEAAFLILETAKTDETNKIFLLDMGEMVPIVELAKKVIQVNGFIPEEDIQIEFSHARPGEKLEEDLYLDTHQTPSHHPKISLVRDDHDDRTTFNTHTQQLLEGLTQLSDDELKQLLFASIKPTKL
ncbi:nucleoside-diphosphate sugar epimerase [Candidatus Uhrbacteria bacterium CG_4_9_14_3_um_filter_50_9]|uniref:Nucleoside-diphosphate sugar epimerase n=1 Tax=Candidatus Uhrbacteria bacterium CG_4_9_14_3_um_filter_50_9 TaxID=1975035 RepID=A0A2M7XBR2_9BACT|nr:MAG: nucleoside-diphosphate sugar epimerase [Candidatus Uhrbacteria bacterium CG_4_9_14_3_um_filter_50_9]